MVLLPGIRTVSSLFIPLVYVISMVSNEHPGWKSYCEEAKRGVALILPADASMPKLSTCSFRCLEHCTTCCKICIFACQVLLKFVP
jgi:hypothetical protein